MSIEMLKWLLGLCISGWIVYLSAERGRIVTDIKSMKEKAETALTKAETLSTLVHAVFLTKEEHRDFDNRISLSIDRLSDRIDKAMMNMRNN